MSISAGKITKAIALRLEHDVWHSPHVTPENRRIRGLFSQYKSNDLPERANISLRNTPREKDREKPLVTFEDVTQAFAIYPERPDRISSSALIKLEGTYGNEEMCAKMKHREGWMLLMPDVDGTGGREMLNWLMGECVPSSRSF